FIKKMSDGVKILNTITRKCRVEKISKYIFSIVLTQGLNRQIRRMCEALDYEVVKLVRTRIMNISLRGIEQGSWRLLNNAEMEKINKLVETSSKTEEASVIEE
ncbi:MAG: 23S rRNA pseudouridine synthase F, partial [Clostridia bacterium]|nr:23S rRNA pseudouridine synthase F [Clostridia bacterium]